MQFHCGVVLILFHALVSLLLRSLFLAVINEGVIRIVVILVVYLRSKCTAFVEFQAFLDKLLLECDAQGATFGHFKIVEHMRRS